jgi:hypothetical protein
MAHENLFKIYIPEPCHEDWGKMTPNEKGAYCKVCAKTVVDFSEETDEDVQNFLLDNAENKICGRFRVSQIESDEQPKLKIEMPKWEFPGFLIPVLTPFRATALALMLCASAMLSSCGSEGYGGGDDDRKLAGTVVAVDTTKNTEIDETMIQGGITPIRTLLDSTNKTESVTVGKIKIESVQDSVQTDSTEAMIKGEIEPVRKMHGVIKRKD